MISKACYVSAYRRKLEELAAIDAIDLTLVVPPYWRTGKRRNLLEPGNDHGYRTIVANPRLNGNHHLHYYPQIGKILDTVRPNLLHIDEEPYDLVTFQAMMQATMRKIPAIFFTWQNLDVSYPLPFSYFRRWTQKHAAGGIAGNQEACQILRRRGMAGPIEVVPQFGVDPEAYPFRQPEAGDTLRVGYAGRIWHGKGLDVLVDALAGLPNRWRLDIAGEGPEETKLRRHIDRLSVTPQVHFLGSRPSTEVPAFLASIDVLVLPSRTLSNWKEQFGRVLIEAMASGVPVIGSDSGEIPQVIGDAGLVFPEGNVVALRKHLAGLAGVAARRDYAKRGRERVLAHFSQQRIAEATATFYRRVLTGQMGAHAVRASDAG